MRHGIHLIRLRLAVLNASFFKEEKMAQNITLSKETELELLKFKNPRTAEQGGKGASQAAYERLHAVLSSSNKIA